MYLFYFVSMFIGFEVTLLQIIYIPLRIPDMWEGWLDKREVVNCERTLVE